MAYLPIELPPGIYKNRTPYASKGRWVAGNLVRWVNGEMQPVGGWTRSGENLEGVVRTMGGWRANDGEPWLAMGSGTKAYVYTQQLNRIYDITPPDLGTGGGSRSGYGSGPYGAGKYGYTPATGQPASYTDTWTFDQFGEDLVGVHSTDGRLMEWDTSANTAGTNATGVATPEPAPSSVMTEVENAPRNNIGVIVTDERYIMLLGADGNPRRVQWCDQENKDVWTPAAENTAGDLDLETEGNIIGGVRTDAGNLVLTNVDAHLVYYVGYEFVYGRKQIAENCGVLTPNAIIHAGAGVVWMGDSGFWIYEGGQVRRLPCEVLNYVFDDINMGNVYAISGGYNAQFQEAWWFYPSSGATEPDRYVFVSIRDPQQPYWSVGEMARTAWHDNDVINEPYACSDNGMLYLHEKGWKADGADRFADVYAESGVYELGQGDRKMNVRKVMQDVYDPETPSVYPYQLLFKTRNAPGAQEVQKGPYTMNAERGYTDTRFSARQLQMRVEATEDTGWRFGTPRLDVVPGGER